MTRTFAIGDRVELVAPFRYHADDEQSDQDFDDELRADADGGRVLGEVRSLDVENDENHRVRTVVGIKFDNGQFLYADPEVLDYEFPPVTENEVAEAIRSIVDSNRTFTLDPGPTDF